MKNKKGISLIVLVITVISTYNKTAKYRKVPPENIMIVIRKITYDKESVRIMLTDSLYRRGNVKTGWNCVIKCRILRWEVVKNIVGIFTN